MRLKSGARYSQPTGILPYDRRVKITMSVTRSRTGRGDQGIRRAQACHSRLVVAAAEPVGADDEAAIFERRIAAPEAGLQEYLDENITPSSAPTEEDGRFGEAHRGGERLSDEPTRIQAEGA
jgi:hypothetical protein